MSCKTLKIERITAMSLMFMAIAIVVPSVEAAPENDDGWTLRLTFGLWAWTAQLPSSVMTCRSK